jgi:hypothetical protein
MFTAANIEKRIVSGKRPEKRRSLIDSVRCAPHATFGTCELSQDAVKALEDRLDFPVGVSWVVWSD